LIFSTLIFSTAPYFAARIKFGSLKLAGHPLQKGTFWALQNVPFRFQAVARQTAIHKLLRVGGGSGRACR